ncbi:MAG: response regulator [Kiritimatiellae bacterium]|nr:response regulator [Kiritimatiellia bacterium]
MHQADRATPLLHAAGGVHVNICTDLEQATQFLREQNPDSVLVDSDAAERKSLMAFIRRHAGRWPLVVLLHHPHEDAAEDFLLAGAQDVLPAAAVAPSDFSRALHLAPLRLLRERHLHEALEQSLKMEAVGRMAGGIAHDYNNLLTVIMNNAILARDALPPASEAIVDLNEQIRIIKQAAALTRRLLIMSRSKPNMLEEVDLCALASGMKKMFRHVTGDRVRLHLLLAEKPVFIRADPIQVEQALLNLVINACDAMWYEGAITITVAVCDMMQEAGHLYFGEPDEPERPRAMISVADTGEGISEEVLPHLFEPFFTTKNADQGTGLGLYQVYSTVQQHQGAISVCSVVGNGAEFRLFFPMQSGVARPQVESPPAPPPAPGREIILLVEDDGGVRRTTRRLLESLGYEVMEAENGREALGLEDSRLARVRLLLSDIMMPDIDGVRLADALRGRHPKLRIILVSGYTDEKLARQGLLPEKYAFVPKPFLDDCLPRLIRALLDEERL